MPAEPHQPRISVVTLCLNAADQLPLTLESVIGQDYPGIEYIIYDGMSRDGTAALLGLYAGLIDRVVTREDAGVYQAMNNAIDVAAGDYLLFMNAGDQFYCANAVGRMVAGLEGVPDIFFGDHIYVDGHIESYRRAAPFDLTAEQLRLGEISGEWLDRIPCHQATFTSLDLLRRLRFDPRLRVGADHELLFMAHEAGARFQYVDEPVCHYFSGGYSVQMGERTKLEGASVYRRFSDYPELVDKFFYPAGAPFEASTRRTGVMLGGFYPEETWMERADDTRGGAWMAGTGCEILSPERASTGIELFGFCGIADQQIDFVLRGETIASAAIPQTHFRAEIAFDRVVPPASVVVIRAARSVEIGDKRRAAVALAIRSLRFQREGEPFAQGLQPGQRFELNSRNLNDTLRVLGLGWSAPENTHIWAVGAASDLWVKVDGAAKHVRMRIGGNPHVPHDRQEVRLEINGISTLTASVARGGRADLDIDCTRSPWRAGAINHLSFHPSDFATPPAESGDTRPLSLCLWTIEVD